MNKLICPLCGDAMKIEMTTRWGQGGQVFVCKIHEQSEKSLNEQMRELFYNAGLNSKNLSLVDDILKPQYEYFMTQHNQ